MLGDADEEGLFREAFGVHVTACRDAVCQVSLDQTRDLMNAIIGG